ncbi:MAG TPA: polyprenyl synthetase family protein [Candidatus Limnocylindria bacterium]|nr:polyprenyl synthetase family protein [Candidatus Limnocylindria bacterium]
MGSTGYETRVAAIDDEIRSLLTQAEAALQPFYGMMLYHLGLDAEHARGGKRLRPLLAALVFETLGGDSARVTALGAALELLHNFTLIHDDIEDQDPRRHHRPTVWSVWGEPQAINAGDGMYAISRLAVQRLRERGFAAERILDLAALLDQTCVRVCEGQFLDISFEARTDVTADRYRAMAARKTGALFAASARGAAVLATDERTVHEQLSRFGAEFGHSFQARDDVQGIWATSDRTGKVEMNDLVKRKKTLPVVLAFEKASPKTRAVLDTLFAPAAPLPAENVERIRQILDELSVRDLIEHEIAEHRERALQLLRGVPGLVPGQPLALLEQLVGTATGATEAAAPAGTPS